MADLSELPENALRAQDWTWMGAGWEDLRDLHPRLLTTELRAQYDEVTSRWLQAVAEGGQDALRQLTVSGLYSRSP